MGPAYRWDDPDMRARARRRAATSLAGMMRALVSSALVVGETRASFWSRQESYVEIDEDLVRSIERAADHEVWFDVLGEGPVRRERLTYACACLDAAEAHIRVDVAQAEAHAFARQHPAEEVPRWVEDPQLQNEALACAVGFYPRMFNTEDMVGELTNRVREHLVTERTQSWVRSEFDARGVCAGRSERACRTAVESLVEAANEGVARGVALTAIWFDTLGIGPAEQKMSAYGWGCVFDRAVLDAIRRRLDELRGEGLLAPVSVETRPSPAREARPSR
jgi:hypothetical protein